MTVLKHWKHSKVNNAVFEEKNFEEKFSLPKNDLDQN